MNRPDQPFGVVLHRQSRFVRVNPPTIIRPYARRSEPLWTKRFCWVCLIVLAVASYALVVSS